jgi:adhesin transport system membrane fusion protein
MSTPNKSSGHTSTESWLKKLHLQLTVTRLLLLGLLIFLTWISLSDMHQTVRSSGQIIAVARNQIIQAADGGVLKQLMVSEGQQVSAGQILANLETTRSEASYLEIKAKLNALHAGLARAKAESSGEALMFQNTSELNNAFNAGQQQAYAQKRQGLEDELNILNAGLLLSEKELQISQALLKTGDISQLEFMRAQRQVQETQGRIGSVKQKYLQEAKQDVIRFEEEISAHQFKLNERKILLDHSILKSPVDGVVKVLRINTVGGVLRAGDELMHISPTSGGYIVEAKINPSDIGELRLGLPVSLKFDAFDFSVYGMLQGTLSYISSDTLTESGPNGATQTYYRVQVQLNPNLDSEKSNTDTPWFFQAERKVNKLSLNELKPGMTATLDIQTRSRTLLQYLIKPVQKAFSGALHER